jgi:methionine synthase II (cobalamin-independent)
MALQNHRNPPFRAEHLGSLLRTRELLDAKTAFEQGRLTMSDLTVIEKKDIQDIVKKQKELGYRALSDGEYCRHSKQTRFTCDLSIKAELLTVHVVASVLGLVFPGP